MTIRGTDSWGETSCNPTQYSQGNTLTSRGQIHITVVRRTGQLHISDM